MKINTYKLVRTTRYIIFKQVLEFLWMRETMRENQEDEFFAISKLILHIVTDKKLSNKQIGMILLKNEDTLGKVQQFIFILRDLKMIDIESSCDGDTCYLYKQPDVTPLNI